MLLYHFPLINDYSNKGFASLYDANGNAIPLTTMSTGFASGGKISSTAKGVTGNLGTSYWDKIYDTYSISIRAYRGNDANNVYGHIIVMRGGSTGKQDLNVRYLNGNLKIGYYNSQTSSVVTEIDVPAEIGWHDIVLNFSFGTLTCYFDCTLVGTIENITYNRKNQFLGNNFIGSGTTTTTLIQDVRIYDYMLSQAEINEYSRALVVHYPLQGNELNSSVLKDVSGFGNDYTLQGTNSYQLDSARGLKSLHTTDTAIYTQTPISSGYTTSFWCKYNGEWKHLCNNGSKYVNGVVNASQYDTIYATLTASGYDIVDYRVYATALSAEDVKNLYNSPIAVSKQHQTMAFEFKENPLYPSKYWRTPTYAEMNYILNTRTNASNLRTLGRVEISSGTYRNGLFLLPDGFTAPSGITVTITTANYTTNSYTLAQFNQLENVGVVFLVQGFIRDGLTSYLGNSTAFFGVVGSTINDTYQTNVNYNSNNNIYFGTWGRRFGFSVRLCRTSSKGFSTSATTKIDFAPANLQYHCTQHIWRFAEHSYDYIGAANANISDNYDGWIDLFGYGTSGVNYSPTLHSTNNADYASSDISNTDNDWGINEIQSYDYNVKNFALNKNGIVQHNEVEELYEYPSKYWHTPTYAEMNYILNTRTNASSRRTLGRVEISSGVYMPGLFLLPDNWVLPSEISMTITTADYTTNNYTIAQFKQLEDAGAVFFGISGFRQGTSYNVGTVVNFGLGTAYLSENRYTLRCTVDSIGIGYVGRIRGLAIRLCRSSQDSHSFSTSVSTRIKFAKSNLQYHCTQHIWRFAEHSYDIIGEANANISDSYNGWIDLFGYGTSGVNYSPTLTSTDNSKYASGDISNTDNDWGVNRILTYEQNSNLSLGLYKDTIITNKLIEN